MTTAEIITTLETFAEEDRLAFMQRVCPTSMRLIGVTMPQLKTVLKEVRQISKGWSVDEVYTASLELIQSGVHEAHLLGLEWASASKKQVDAFNVDQLSAYNHHMDNWVSVDTYAVRLWGQGWRMGTVSDRSIDEMLGDSNVWQRRIGVVSTVALNLRSRGGTGDIPRTLHVCKQVVDDHQDMIVKALSWALREVSKQDQEPVWEFLDLHRDRLHSRVIREVEKKLDTGRKNG